MSLPEVGREEWFWVAERPEAPSTAVWYFVAAAFLFTAATFAIVSGKTPLTTVGAVVMAMGAVTMAVGATLQRREKRRRRERLRGK